MISKPPRIAESTRPQRNIVHSVLKRSGFAFLFVVPITAFLLLPGMQRETQRSEAYLPQLEEAAHHSPYDGRLLGLLGGRLVEAHEYTPAMKVLEHAVAAGENNPDLWLTLAACAAATGNPKSGAYLKVGARSSPGAAITDALARVQALGADASPNTFARAICPQGAASLVARYGSGSILSRWSEWSGRRHPEQSGFTTRQKWAAAAPNDAEAQRLWGEALTRNRRYREADPVLQQALSLAPSSPIVHLAIADLRDRQDLPGQAILEYLAALKLRPRWIPALLGLGHDALALHLPTSAADVFQQAASGAPQSADAWIGLGAADVEAQQNQDQALKAFQTAARLVPARTDYYNDYSAALKISNHFEEAEAVLRRRMAAAPDDALCRFLLATLLLDYKSTPEREREADALTHTALKLGYQNPAARQQLSQIMMRQGKTAEAISILQTSLAESPGDVNTLQTLARAYQQAGQAARAQSVGNSARQLFAELQTIDVLKSKVQHDPSSLPLHEQLAALYIRTNQNDKAQQEQGIISLLRDHPELHGQGTQTLENLIRETLTPH